MGFTHYDEVEVPAQPTIQEMIASLSGQQRAGILKGFRKNVEYALIGDRLQVKESVVKALCDQMDEVEERARAYMLQQVVITPEVLDPITGEVVTPAVYNDAITGAADLLSRITDDFSEDLTGNQVQTILSAMVEDSKHDGTGDWNFYKTEVVK